MTTSSIEASSSGLKLSYLRFISDSAPGFALLLLLGFAWKDSCLPRWAQHQEFRVLFAALSFFLATPVGLVINAVSYFLLGHIQTAINRMCFLSQCWPVLDARRSLMLQETTDHFRFTVDDWAERTDVYEELVESYRPDLAFRIEHLRGLKRFARCLALLSFSCFFCLNWKWGSAIVVGTVAAHFVHFLWTKLRGKTDHEAVEVAIEAIDPKPAPVVIRIIALLRKGQPLIVIVLALIALIIFARVIGVTWGTAGVASAQVCTLAIASVGLLVAGMVEFYQRATIAMYLHVECPPTVRHDVAEIRDALSDSAKRART
jgi:hypothetical protein